MRQSQTDVSQIFLDRWSPRAFDGGAMPHADLMTIIDAAHWAPSAFNHQPWRFLYALRGDAHWEGFLDLLLPFNRQWAAKASALVFFVSDRLMGAPDKPSHSHSFDTGAAWAMFAMQATLMGYHSHGMSGIAMGEAVAALGVGDGFRLEAAAVVGRIGDPETLPEKLRAREAPSERKPLSDIAFAGPLPPQD